MSDLYVTLALLQAEIKKTKQRIKQMEKEEKEKKKEFFALHKFDEDITIDLRNRLLSVDLYESDKKIPNQLRKRLSDMKYDRLYKRAKYEHV